MSSLLGLPNELLLLVAEPLRQKDINSFLQTNHRLAFLLTPLLHALAVRDVAGLTALQWAAWCGYGSLARLVLEKGADINFIPPAEEEKTHKTALHLASENGDEDMVKLLLDHRADVSIRTPCGTTALHWAVKSRSGAVVMALLEHGADASVVDINGNPPLLWAIGYGLEAIVKMLLDYGADISFMPKGATPLHWAARLGNEAIVRVLLGYGADGSARDTTGGRTALDYATLYGNQGVVKVLMGDGRGAANPSTYTVIRERTLHTLGTVALQS